MASDAFVPAPHRLSTFHSRSLSLRCAPRRPVHTCAPRRVIKMQIPPFPQPEPPLTPEQRGPPDYKWDPNYPGTLKPGSVDDNFPLRKVLESEVFENMKYEEIDIDDRTPLIFELEEDLLQWLAQQGRLIPRGASDDEFDSEVDRQMSGITEEDLEFGDEDSKMIAYYSRQGEGSSAGASTDYGGFSESSADLGPGF